MTPEAVRDEIDALYAALAREVGATGVACAGRGDCCDFDRVEHTLYATDTEIARAAEFQASRPDEFPVDRSAGSKLCPFWRDRRCLARDVRPLGCRVYFCDPGYAAEHAGALYERYHARLKALIDTAGIPYGYRPFVAALREP